MPDAEGYNNELRESNTILHFRQGLRPVLSEEVIRRDAEATVKEELKKVQQTEQMLRAIAERKKRHERNATSTDLICNVESKLEQIAETLSRHEEQIAVVNATGTQPPSRDPTLPGGTQRPANNVYQDDRGRSFDRRNTYERRDVSQPRNFGNFDNRYYNRKGDYRYNNRTYSSNDYCDNRRYNNDSYNRNYGQNDYYNRRDGGNYDNRGYNDQRKYNRSQSRGPFRGNSRGRGFRGNSRGRRYDNRSWQQRDRRDFSRPREDFRANDRRNVSFHDSSQTRERNDSGGHRGGYGLQNLPLLSIVTILATLLSVAGANQYQICSTRKGQFYVTPPKPSQCDLPPLINPKASRVRVYTPRAAPVTFKAFKCHNITETGCSDYFFGIKTNEFTEPPRFNAINPDACRGLIANATEGRGPNITTIRPQLWATNDEIIIPRGLIGRQCRSIQKHVIQEGSVGSKGGHHVESLLLSPNHCAIRNLSCSDSEGTVVWHIPDEHAFCSHRTHGIVYKAGLIETHLLLPAVQSAFILAPHAKVPDAIRQCIPGHIVPAGNDAYIELLPINETASTHSSQPHRFKREVSNHLWPKSTNEKTLAMEQRLLAGQRKLTAIRDILSLRPAEALFNTDINRLVNNRQSKRHERSELVDKMQNQLQDLHRQLQLRRTEEQKLLKKIETLTKNRRHDAAVSQAPRARELLSRTTTPTTTTTTQTANRAGPAQFPYVVPKTTIMSIAPNGTKFYHSLTRKVYSSMTQLSHGSAIVNGSVIYYVFWPSPDTRSVRRYRKSKWDAEESRRQGPRYAAGRSTRDLEEILLWTILGTKDRFTVEEAEVFYLAFDNAENRKHFHELYMTVPTDDYYDDELTPLSFDLDVPVPDADYATSSEQLYEEYEEVPSRHRRHLPDEAATTTAWDYAEDDEADKELSKRIHHRHQKNGDLFPPTTAETP
ncbi:Integrase core domain containing protein [Aphelenchoides avenae]|nr:Integrase core domain containing protein [Aphelenchus avenae]